MSIRSFLDLAHRAAEGNQPLSDKEIENIINVPEEKIYDLLPGATFIREHFFQNRIHLCVICNGKSGKCSEDCTFCAQSKYYKTQIDTYPLLPEEQLQKGAEEIEGRPVQRYSIVTSGKGLSDPEIEKICRAYEGIKGDNLALCASLGILEPNALGKLAKSGVSRYHHNLETARSHFHHICTTHTYDQRIKTIKAAQQKGLSICSGGIFGLGETDAQAAELALELKTLDVDAVPLNFLSPIQGTPLEGAAHLTPLRCLKLIAMFRYILPDKQILICGGRQVNLGILEPLIFLAGASGIMTGNYLTTDGQLLENDLQMLEQMGLMPDCR